MVDTSNQLHVQVCYATPQRQILLNLIVPAGTVLQEAIVQSSILTQAPEIDLAVNRVGIYGKLKTLETVLREHDRIEIYRPLIADPKESRRKRAEKKSGKSV
jgi:putative ubiquitin-RnfH superfamily antitoxin RatB of RatAB toxin-antitoxin module